MIVLPKEMAALRVKQAEQCLLAAETLLSIDDYRGSANRSYYAIFHCMRSVLALEEKDFAKHSGVISYFRKNYIKTGIFPVLLSDIIESAFEARNDCDYDDLCLIEKEDVEQQIEEAKVFLKYVTAFLKAKEEVE